MFVDQDALVQLIQRKGPVIPAHIAKDIKKDLLMTSAILSELSAKKKIRMTHLKIGGSPLYYVQGQEHLLEKFADKLDRKDKIAYDLLKEKKIVRESTVTPPLRVLFRRIKDFAVPLEVSYNNQKEIFWKWYLTPASEAESSIKFALAPPKPQPAAPQPAPKKPSMVKKPEPLPKPIPKPAPPKPTMPKPEVPKPAPKPKKQPEPAKEEIRAPVQKPLPKKEPVPKPLQVDKSSSLLTQVKNFLISKKIRTVSYEPSKKKTQEELVIQIPTPVGEVTYLCIALSKKSFSETDITNAFAKSQLYKLPVLILTRAKVTKKIHEKITKDFKNITISSF